jgi:hypothetical protein
MNWYKTSQETMLGYKGVSYNPETRTASSFWGGGEIDLTIGGWAYTDSPKGMYLGSDKDYVLDYYSGMTDGEEILLTYQFNIEDALSICDTSACSGEIRVKKAQLINIEHIDKDESGEIVEGISPFASNWYNKIILADRDSYLRELGATEDIVQYINTLPDQNSAQLIINEFRKNPTLTLIDLQKIIFPEQQEIYLPAEKALAKNSHSPQMEKWILVQMRKIRQTIESEGHDDGIHDSLIVNLDEIKDWARLNDIDIASYTPEQAIQTSQDWHAAMAAGGKGLLYNDTKPELILHGPQWQNEEWNGWTIQQVSSENDLTAEGYRMDHCVGGYCDAVESGDAVIYSLRDPSNNPHVTIEVDRDGTVQQIQGKSNSDPKDGYKAMIKEWVEIGEHPEFHMSNEDLFSDTYYMEDLLTDLRRIGSIDEYGFPQDDFENMYYSLDDIGDWALNIEDKSRQPEFTADLDEVVDLLIDKALLIDNFNNDKRYSQIKNLEAYFSKLSEDANDMLEGYYDYDGYPQQENYETEEEFEEAEQEFQDIEQDWRDEQYRRMPRGGFSNAGFTSIQKLREQKIIPEYDDMYRTKHDVMYPQAVS